MHTMEADPTANNIINVVIVGKVGNGKSATRNSILGKECFDSEYSFSAVTCSSELKKIKLKGGRIVNIIDTPGGFWEQLEAEERATRLEAERIVRESLKDEEIQKLNEGII